MRTPLAPKHFGLLATLVLFVLATACASASASTIYSFTLTPTTGGGNVGGTLLLTLATPVPATGSFFAIEGGAISSTTTNLQALQLTMSNGATFSLAQENGAANVTFFNNTLSNFSYNDNNFPVLPSIGIGGTHYDFSTNGNFSGPGYTGGTIRFNGLAVAATPEPSSLALMGTGLMGLVAVVRRRLVR